MESTMAVVERLVDGMHGEDPGGARLYMSHLRENETLAMLECFEDMLSGKLPVVAPSASGDPGPLSGSNGGSMAYRLPPSEFLKVLMEGNTTRLGALHAVMKAIGRGDLQGRAASLCISEVRMCLSTCSYGTEICDGGRRSSSIHRRMPLAQLRELAGICLSFSMDTPSVSRRPAAGIYAGGRGGAEDANNRRVLMLEALPAVLEACCAVAVAEAEDDSDEDDDDDSSESESDEGEGDEEPLFSQGRHLGEGNGGAATARADTTGVVAAARGKKPKGKGKPEWDCITGSRRGIHTGASGSVHDRAGAFSSRGTGRRRRKRKSKGRCQGGLPESGEIILWDVTDALLDRPWPLRLVLPLLVVFEELFELLELLGRQATERIRQAGEGGNGAMSGKGSVWTRVRSRLMEVVRMGGLDGADFTGVVRQVCILCDIDNRQDYDHDAYPSSPTSCEGLSGGNVAGGTGTIHRQSESVLLPNERGEEVGGVEREVGTQARGQARGRTFRRSGSWLSCLRQLYAAVPTEWISTVELVLEQTLHQMPGVAESLLDAIQDAISSIRVGGEAGSGLVSGSTVVSSHREGQHSSGGLHPSASVVGFVTTSPTSISNDLALLILLLREASPLRACSLPLLPVGVDRGRRAEESVRRLFLEAARCVLERPSEIAGGNGGKDGTPGREGAFEGTRALVRAVLCLEPRMVVGGNGHRGRGGGGGSSTGSPASSWGSGSSGVASERASQLLELALRWLEEGDARTPSGGNVGVLRDKERGSGAELSIEDIACEMISEVFDVVAEARPRLLRALLSGVFDKSQGGESCAWSYMRAWEALMAQEAEQDCRRLLPYSQGVSDALGRLTLLPRGRARRIVESMLPLADVCPTQASALISLCRKCSVQGEWKGRLLTLHAVTCILAWNARRARNGRSRRSGGCLDIEGSQEDLVGMFRRAFDGGLQTAARADALHLLASKLAAPAVDDLGQSMTFLGTPIERGTRSSGGPPRAEPFEVPLRQSPTRPVLDHEPSSGIDLTALGGLRDFLAMRLFRFFAHKDEVIGVDPNGFGENDGDDPRGAGRYSRDSTDRRRGKGKGKERARRRRSGRVQLVPLRLLEERGPFGKDHNLGAGGGRSRGDGITRNVRGQGVIPRDAIGQLLKCCWALVPAREESTTTESRGGANERVVPGAGKRAEAEAIARAVLGEKKRKKGAGERREGGQITAGAPAVCTREGEALVAVVEFLQGGGGMKTLAMVAPPKQQTPGYQEADDDVTPPLVPPPPSCNPQSVSPLAGLGVVVTLAEALVDCLLNGISCPRATSECPLSAGSPAEINTGRHIASSGERDSVGPAPAHPGRPRALWAVADVFTLLAAATRAADNIAEPTGGIPRQAPIRAPESLSEIIVSLPADTLGLWRGSEPNSAVAGTEDGNGNEEGGAMEERSCCTGEAGFGDEVGRTTLLSASSALVFVNEFLGWAAQVKGKSPASLVAEGWDGGIGVWLGLVHSIRTLIRALKTTRGRESYISGNREGAQKNDPSAEATALAVFQLRAAVGTPCAAGRSLEPMTVLADGSFPSDGRLHAAPCSSSPDDGGAAGSDNAGGANATSASASCRAPCRPPAGTMIRGFLKKMDERWKAALPWNLPGAAPPRRASPRLERRSQRRGFGYSNATESLKAEAEDLFFALRGELLRAERLVLSTLLVGPYASLAGRAWAMKAALASARPRSGEGTADGGSLEGPRPTSSKVAVAPSFGRDDAAGPPRASRVTEQPPESGSGPARAAPRVIGGTTTSVSRKVSPLAGIAAEEEEQIGRRRSGGKNAEGRGCSILPTTTENGGDGMRDGLGRLCLLAAAEMREGLETGLSVKLSQAYLDLIELLGNAALDHPYHAHRIPAGNAVNIAGLSVAAASQHTFDGAGSTTSNGIVESAEREREDTGGVLLSILTCHTISQHKLFKRLVRGAVRFDDIGVSQCLQAPRTAATLLEELQSRDREFSFLVGDRDGVGGRDGIGGNSSVIAPSNVTDPSVRRPPPPLERSSRLLVHCVRWIRERHRDKRGRAPFHLFEEDEDNSSEEEEREGEGVQASGKDSDIGLPGEGKGDSDEGSPELYPRDGPQSRYSSRPEEVKFASSRECLAAMRTALVECETVLSSAGLSDVTCGDGGTSTASELADVLATIAPGLREFFAPAVMTRAAKSKAGEPPRGSASTATIAIGPTSPQTRAVNHDRREKSGGKNASSTAGGAPPLAALDVFPDAIKLLLMRVLERVYLVGKGAIASASAALAKPSSTAVATVAGVRSISPPQPTPPPTPSVCPSPPLTSKRRRPHREAAANASRPGDQAGGAPIKVPSTRNKATTAGGGRSRRSQSKPEASTLPGEDIEGDVAWAARSKQRGSRSGVAVAQEVEGPVNSLLAPVLPAVALASGDCLRLMLEARTWAEALRSNTRRAGDDPCKKRASTMLFKIERCELEIAAAAQKARQFLESFQDGAQKSTVEAKTAGCGGVVKSRKRLRACVGRGGGGNGSGVAKARTDTETTTQCDDKVEGALRLLASGADILAAWRRDSAAKAKSKAARLQRDGKRGKTLNGQQQPGPVDNGGEERLTRGRGNGARDRFSGVAGKRRRSSVARVRSRNVVIDGWLEEGGEGGGGRGDAFVDLEDFIEA